MTTLRGVAELTAAALQLDVSPTELAREFQAQLRAAGYSIHRRGECVHPRVRPGDLGREMTAEERAAVGLDS